MEHYHYGAGVVGCLYDVGPFYAESETEAVEALAQICSLTKRQAKTLADDGIVVLSHDGMHYADITACDDACNPKDYE